MSGSIVHAMVFPRVKQRRITFISFVEIASAEKKMLRSLKSPLSSFILGLRPLRLHER
jgi:hypothetical protein